MKKNIIIILISLFIYCSCDLTIPTTIQQENDSIETIDENISYGKPMMMNTFEKEFSKQQFDSICKADKISNNLSKWHMFISKDAETGLPFREYMYIKSIGKDEVIYRLIQVNQTKYKITKRIIIEK